MALCFIVTWRQAWWTAAMDSLNMTGWTVCLMVSINLTWTDIALIRLLVATAGASFALWWMIARALRYLTMELSRGVRLERTAAVGLVLLYLDRTRLRFCAVTVWRTQRNLRDLTVNKTVTLYQSSSNVFSLFCSYVHTTTLLKWRNQDLSIFFSELSRTVSRTALNKSFTEWLIQQSSRVILGN